MKINRLFSIAAAALMMVACSSEETALKNNPAVGSQMPFTATIAVLGSGAGTRTAYTESGTDINVTWSVGDEIALIHNGVKDVATVKTINADGSATITGFITKANNGDGVEVCYPAALWEWNDEAQGAIRNATFVTNINAQDGTLKYIQDNLDVRMAKGQLKVDGDNATLSASATLESQIAIWKLALQDDAETPAALSATQVSVIKDGETPETLAGTSTLSTATSTVYLAMPPMSESEATVAIKAATADGTYIYENSGLTLKAGNYYQSTVTMAPAATDLSKLTGDYTAKNGETLTGTLAGNYKISIAAGATVTLDGVTINGENSARYIWAGITCEGDATIILKDGKTNTVTGFFSDYPGIQAGPTGTTLTIKGTGSLTASSKGGGAGIGGGYGIACGNIKIEGGTITATGSSDAAGIGGAHVSTCGSITISGGTITATGGNEGAGIGSGYEGSCGDITISGGTVTATGGNEGAGIGSGYDNSVSCGDITISGGTVTATGGTDAAGIGSGYEGSCGDITISGGTVEATGKGKGAGIGTGFDGECGNITITTGVTKVTATKGSDSPNSIGKGKGNDASCGTVTIGCTLDNDGNPVGGTTGAISTSPYTYDPSAPAGTTVTWNSSNCSSMNIIGPDNATIADIKLSCNAGRVSASWYGGIEFSARATGGFTFTAPTGKKFTKIEMSFDGMPSGWDNAAMSGNLGTGWPTDIREIASNKKVTWTGTAASTVDLLTGADEFNGAAAASSIVFTLVDAE